MMEPSKKKFILDLWRGKAISIRKKPFELHSGGKSHMYVNPMIYITRPEKLAYLTGLLIKMIKRIGLTRYKLSACPSVAAPIITSALASKLKKEYLVLTEEKHEALKTNIHGKVERGDEIILVDDVTTTGLTFFNMAKRLVKQGAWVYHAVVPVVTHKSAVRLLEKNEIKCHYFVSLHEILTALWGKLSKEERKIINEELEEKPIL